MGSLADLVAMATVRPGQLGPGLLSVLPCLTLVVTVALVLPLEVG